MIAIDLEKQRWQLEYIVIENEDMRIREIVVMWKN